MGTALNHLLTPSAAMGASERACGRSGVFIAEEMLHRCSRSPDPNAAPSEFDASNLYEFHREMALAVVAFRNTDAAAQLPICVEYPTIRVHGMLCKLDTRKSDIAQRGFNAKAY